MARVAIVVGPEFEDSEYSVPRRKLEEVGHQVIVLGTKRGESVRGKRGREHVVVDVAAREVKPDEFHACVIPGGYSPDKLRMDPSVVGFIRAYVSTGRLVAAVCHGPQLLIEADAVRGRTLTSWPSVKKDLENAGAKWVDQEVCVDGSFVTSRKPEDLEAFCRAIVERLR